jgi:hypothetical protein
LGRGAGSALAVAALVVAYVWDDVLLGAPVAAASKWTNAWLAWLTFAALYSLGSWWLANRYLIGRTRSETRFAILVRGWIDRLQQSSHGLLGGRLVRAGGVAGFALSSWLAGGLVTSYLLVKSGYRGDAFRAAGVSCWIFGALFAAQYAGIGALL